VDSRCNTFKLYPNPAHNYTTLQYNCRYANLSYSIYDTQGKALIYGKLKTMDDISLYEKLIDLSILSSGNYQIVIKSENRTIYTDKNIVTK